MQATTKVTLTSQFKQVQDLRKFTFEPPFIGVQDLAPYHMSRLCVSPEVENTQQKWTINPKALA